jgi:hypothetical protein
VEEPERRDGGVRARRRLAAALAAAAVALAVLGGFWVLQAATLPAPDPGHLVAARALSWLAGNRLVESTFVVGESPPVRSSCVRTWLPAGGSREQAVRLTIADSTRVIPIGRPYLTVRGRQAGKPRGPLLARLALAGCAPVLDALVGGLVKHWSSTPVGRARLGDRPALTLRIWTSAGGLTVYLDPASKRPLAVALAGRLAGRAQLRFPEPSTGTAAGEA